VCGPAQPHLYTMTMLLRSEVTAGFLPCIPTYSVVSVPTEAQLSREFHAGGAAHDSVWPCAACATWARSALARSLTDCL